MKAIRWMPRPGRAMTLALVGFLAGCGGMSPPQPADPARGQEALTTILDAWQKGEAPEALNQRQPPIYVVDHEWRAGQRLLRYELGAQEPSGGSLRCRVQLTLKGRSGGGVRKAAIYSVGTSPVLTVHRDDDL